MGVDIEARAWFLFGGCAFFQMGVTLAADAKAHAAAALQWGDRQADAAAAARLRLAYRVGGLTFCLVGAVLVAGVLACPQTLAGYLKPMTLGGGGRLVGGLSFIAGGAGMAAMKRGERPRAEFSSQAAFGAGWLLVAAFLIFGSFLLSRLGGQP